MTFAKYHKINGPFKRDDNGKLIPDSWVTPEFGYLKDNLWQVSEKIDGTNIRIFYDGDRIEIGGRTDKANIPTHLLEYLQKTFTHELLHSVFPSPPSDGLVIFGEGYGHKINGGGKYFNDPKDVGFILFDIRIGDYYLQKNDLYHIAESLGISMVPILDPLTLTHAINLVSAGLKSRLGYFHAEGVVVIPFHELKLRNGGRIIIKIKHRDFYLGGNE